MATKDGRETYRVEEAVLEHVFHGDRLRLLELLTVEGGGPDDGVGLLPVDALLRQPHHGLLQGQERQLVVHYLLHVLRLDRQPLEHILND